MFFENYVRLCNSVHKSPSAVAIEMGIAKPTVSRWKNGSKPNHATVVKVADYFGVDVSALLDEGSERENEKKPTPLSGSGHGYPPKYDLLTPENREIVDQLIAGLVENQSPD